MEVKKVMVFGVFDGLHEGHRAFLKQAKACGDYLIVVVSSDRNVQVLKTRPPHHSATERAADLKKIQEVDEVVIGDDEAGSWKIFERFRPDVIALGYDQEALRNALENYFKHSAWRPEVRMMGEYHGMRYHTRLLREKKMAPDPRGEGA